jgi:hypothetical protein
MKPPIHRPIVLIFMGVAGCGKTTVANPEGIKMESARSIDTKMWQPPVKQRSCRKEFGS